MLTIKNLSVTVSGKEILNGLNLEVNKGETHAIMGPNGSGKSTLAYTLAGHKECVVSNGNILLNHESLLDLDTEHRAHKGLFLAMQYPVELPGVNNMTFMRESLNSIRRSKGEKEYDSLELINLIRQTAKQLKLDEKLLKRNVNEGFSGGEKKRNEILQMALLEPKLAILDETDSGLDIDALRIIANGVNMLRTPERAIILITHYQRLLDYIQPDYVHVLIDGKIVRSGDKQLALELEDKGYNWIVDGAAA
ncbi:MAG: Fe-S cluster assembly ATPase SufC [Gammaproteobacteria bacterium]|nr:Fe-S cluster assembly ATPase SufC [Gammaproteobacteria bacterium]